MGSRRLIIAGQRAKERAITKFDFVVRNQPTLQSSAKNGNKPARLERVKILADGNIEAEVDMSKIGRSVDDLAALAPQIADACKADGGLVVRKRSAGVASVVFHYTDPLHSSLLFEDMPAPKNPRGDIVPRWVGGLDESGEPMEVPIDKPLAVGGEQGSGKSVFAWDLLGSLLQQGYWVLAFVIDPKGGMKLGRLGDHEGQWMGRLKVQKFHAGDDVKQGVKVIEHAYNALDIRAKDLAARKVRRFSPGASQEEPIILLLMDEALDYSELWKKSDSVLLRYARKARAVGGTLIAIFQYGHASELGVGQKVFGARFCFRAARETADTILGTGSYERGAKTDKIPRSQPGIGFYVDDEGQMKRFRAAHATDEVVDQLALGNVPEKAGRRVDVAVQQVACYRLFRKDAVSLYVGQSVNPWGNMDSCQGRPYGSGGRFEQHEAEKPWWDDVDWSQTLITWHDPSKIDAVEKAEIHRLGPLYNDKLNRNNPLRVDWRKDKVVDLEQRRIEKSQAEPQFDLDGEVLEEETEWSPAAHWGSE